jgi:uncharacterized protein (DUF488 family)
VLLAVEWTHFSCLDWLMHKLFTIGYSGHTIESFIALLKSNKIDVVCDVRSTPYSKYKPDFSRRTFRQHLNAVGIKYKFFGEELGARPKDRDCYVHGQATYEKISKTEFFRTGLDRIKKGAESLNLALVCSEEDPIECHRAVLVCSNLEDIRSRIVHIHSDGRLEDQAAFEKRLVSLFGLTPLPLLQQPDDWPSAISKALQKQSEAIAYREPEWSRYKEKTL